MNAGAAEASESSLKLANAPIVEAIVDIDCDMPPGFELTALESRARDIFGETYSKFRAQLIQEHQIKHEGDQLPEMSVRRGLLALQLLHDDERQLVQVRAQGFSFNRLAPYTSLDDYLPEIERTWKLFAGFASPVQIRSVRLRYINRILLPMMGGRVDLDQYLKLSPTLPDQDRLTFAGFLNQHLAVEAETGNQVNIVLTSQTVENEQLPLIFDITAACSGNADPNHWSWILSRVESLRSLKNRVFKNTLTEQCLNLFRR